MYFKRIAPWTYQVQSSVLGSVTIDARSPEPYVPGPEPIQLSDDEKRAIEAEYKVLAGRLFLKGNNGCELRKHYKQVDKSRFDELRRLFDDFAIYRAVEANRRREYTTIKRMATSWLEDHRDAARNRDELAARGLRHGDPVVLVLDQYSHVRGCVNAKGYHPVVKVTSPPLHLNRLRVVGVRDINDLYKPGTEPPVRQVPSIEFEHLCGTLVPAWDESTRREEWFMIMRFYDPFTPLARRVLKNGKLSATEIQLYHFNFDRALERIRQKSNQYELAI